MTTVSPGAAGTKAQLRERFQARARAAGPTPRGFLATASFRAAYGYRPSQNDVARLCRKIHRRGNP